MRGCRRDGFALVAVLWILVLVGAVGVSFQADARAERRAVANARAASQARWAARAGLARMMNEIDRALDGGAGAPVLRIMSDTILAPLDFSWEGVSTRVLALDARARVQLNLAEEVELRSLFTALGLDVNEARALADAIIDWRDPDALPRPRGAEARKYASLRPPSRPADAPFETVDDLQRVFGMSPQIYRLVAPYLAVVGDRRVNVNAAPTPVLLTLPGIDYAAASAIVSRRGSRPYRNPYELLASLPRASREWIQTEMDLFIERIAFGPRELEVVATATMQGSPIRARLWSNVILSGGSSWKVVRVVER